MSIETVENRMNKIAKSLGEGYFSKWNAEQLREIAIQLLNDDDSYRSTGGWNFSLTKEKRSLVVALDRKFRVNIKELIENADL